MSRASPPFRTLGMWPSQFFWRLFGAYGILVLGSISLLGWILLHRAEQYEQRQTELTLLNKARSVQQTLLLGQPSSVEELRADIQKLAGKDEPPVRLTLID